MSDAVEISWAHGGFAAVQRPSARNADDVGGWRNAGQTLTQVAGRISRMSTRAAIVEMEETRYGLRVEIPVSYERAVEQATAAQDPTAVAPAPA